MEQITFLTFSVTEYFTYIPGLSDNQMYVPGPSVRSMGGEQRTISLDVLVHILRSRLDLYSAQPLNPNGLELNKAPGDGSHRTRRPGTAWPAPGDILRTRTLGYRLALVLSVSDWLRQLYVNSTNFATVTHQPAYHQSQSCLHPPHLDPMSLESEYVPWHTAGGLVCEIISHPLLGTCSPYNSKDS